jgi:hypothetical protein
MNRVAQISLVVVLITLVILVILRPKNTNKCKSLISSQYEYFTPETPPTSGTKAAENLKHEIVKDVTDTGLGIQDRPIAAAPALDSTQSSIVKVPTPVDSANDELMAENGYESMFDTKLAPSWSSKTEKYTDEIIIQQPNTVAGTIKIPNNLPAASQVPQVTPGFKGIDSRGQAMFSNLVECNQRNYLTAQNFWEYNYKYPIVPPEGSSPLGSNYADNASQQNPLTEFKIITANKDGGQPYPSNSFFRPN